jgi:hypothetical protein
MPARSRRKPGEKPVALADVQRLMAQAISRPLTRDDGMQRAWTDGSPAAAVAEQIIKPNDRLTSFERLQIYNQQYWWRLLASFEEDYGGVRAVIGPRKFDRLAVAYIEQCGSKSWTMRNLGSRLGEFLRAHPALTAPQSALALDVARVEWARVIAFDGPEKPALDPQRIATISPDRLRISLQPYITLLELAYPVDELLLKLKEGDIETGAFSNAVSADRTHRRKRITARRSRHAIHLAVHRHDLSVYYKRLEPEAYELLCALRDGDTLDAACEKAFATSKDLPESSAAKIQRWFATWMQLGWLCKGARPPRRTSARV